MKCRVEIEQKWDKYYWVIWEKFTKYLKPGDLECRESLEVEDYYLYDWFEDENDGVRCFKLPKFHLKNGQANFINGRHRAVLLSRQPDCDVVLMTLTNFDPIDSISEKVLTKIVKREIETEEIFDLPDLGFRGTRDV